MVPFGATKDVNLRLLLIRDGPAESDCPTRDRRQGRRRGRCRSARAKRYDGATSARHRTHRVRRWNMLLTREILTWPGGRHRARRRCAGHGRTGAGRVGSRRRRTLGLARCPKPRDDPHPCRGMDVLGEIGEGGRGRQIGRARQNGGCQQSAGIAAVVLPAAVGGARSIARIAMADRNDDAADADGGGRMRMGGRKPSPQAGQRQGEDQGGSDEALQESRPSRDHGVSSSKPGPAVNLVVRLLGGGRHRTAIGLPGEPVAPTMGSGANT